MSHDPREQAAARPLPLIGEGCTRRYDPQALGDQHGTEFPGAMQLWARLGAAAQEARPDEVRPED